MKPRPPLTKVQTIQISLRCFTLGLLGLLPLIGLPFAIAACGNYFRTARRPGPEWNPAKSHLRAGYVIAALSIAGQLIAIFAIIAICLNNYVNGDSSHGD